MTLEGVRPRSSAFFNMLMVLPLLACANADKNLRVCRCSASCQSRAAWSSGARGMPPPDVPTAMTLTAMKLGRKFAIDNHGMERFLQPVFSKDGHGIGLRFMRRAGQTLASSDQLIFLTPAGMGSKLKLKVVFKRTVENYGFSNSTYFPKGG